MPSAYAFSLDTYPGPKPVSQDAHPVDGMILGRVTAIIADRAPGDNMGDAGSPARGRAIEFFDGLLDLGIDLQRIRVGSAIAQMDFSRGMSTMHRIRPEDFSAET